MTVSEMVKAEVENFTPFSKPKSFGFSTAGTKKRKNRKPETLLYCTVRR